MIRHLKIHITVVLLFITCALFSQGEANKWYFGQGAGLDFNTSPPTVIVSSSMPISGYSYASIADAAGNLLFYTNGGTVWDHTNAVMANGTGLNGLNGASGSQRVLIVKKPASASIYYIFTSQWNGIASGGLFYSEVDMTLASGNGSVTVKNTPLAIGTGTGNVPGKLTATRHCNGTDIWVVGRDWYYNNSPTSGTTTASNNFRAYAVTPTGVNPVPVTSSPITYTYSSTAFFGGNDWGGMKISPNGKKLGVAIYNNWASSVSSNNNSFELFDFDNTTGVVSNSVVLLVNPSATINNYSWGCEFSPDGTKFYGSSFYSIINSPSIYQWDLCAGSPAAIAASLYTVATIAVSPGVTYFAGMQMAPDGKIYVSRQNGPNLDVINNPNALGAACNYVAAAQSVSPKTCFYNLPNFMNSYFVQHPAPTPFTFTASPMYGCQTASFNSVYAPNISVVGCSATGYSVTGLSWNFGDPVTGPANTSTLTNPLHAFSSLGTYTVREVLYYSCGAANDTIFQTVNINVPCISVNVGTITCAALGSATVSSLGGIGPFSFTWMPTAQTNSVANGLSPGTYTITVHDFGNNFTYTASTTFNSAIPLTGNLSNSSSITCNGASTGTAAVTNIAGGSPSQNYQWTNGLVTYTAPAPTNLSAGVWSLTVTDALTGCLINQSFFINQPPALTLNLSSGTATSCVGTGIALSGTATGGSPIASGPGYTYSWTAGPPTSTYTAGQASGGNYVYTLTAKDVYSCAINATIPVSFVNNPALSVPNVSICPLQTGTLTVSGASTYTWDNGSTGNTLTGSPLSDQQYTVTGSALGCTSVATASIILKPVPVPTLSSNSPICNGQALHLSGLGATGYVWHGPLAYVSSLQNPTIAIANPNNSGAYNVTLTAANSCTASAAITVTINPTPTISVSGGTVCQTQTLHLTANSFAGAAYQWTGPHAFSSAQQNPSIVTPTTLASGIYTVKVTSTEGCTNTAVVNASVVALPIPLYSTNSPRCFGTSLVFNASASTGGVSYSWNGPNSFTSSAQNPTISSVTLPAAGVYTLIVTAGPCVVSHTAAAVVVNPLPLLTFTNTGPACYGKPLQLTATGSGTSYAWAGPGGFTFHQLDTIFNAVSFSNAGTYSVVTKDGNGCVSSLSTSVTVLANPTLVTTGDVVCRDEPSSISASGASTYAWLGPAGYSFSGSPANILVTSYLAVGIYTVTGTAANSCTSIATTSVGIQPLPQPSLAITATACINTPISLQGFGGNKYVWTGPAHFYSASRSASFAAFSQAMGGTYSLTVIDSIGCKNYTTGVVTIFEPPTGSLISSRVSHCVPFSSEFKLEPTAPVLNASWQLDGKTFNSESFSYTFNTPNDYILYGTFTGAYCTGTSTFAVHAYKKPEAAFSQTPEKPVEGYDQVLFTNSSSGDSISSWSWHIKDNTGTYKISTENASYLYPNAGTYPVAMVVNSKYGCSDTLIRLIKIEPDFNVFVPNTFTPNEDGKNELFYPVTRNASLLSFSVFDRWGNKIYSSDNPAAVGWDGTYKGENCKQDVYVWKLSVTGNNGELKNMSGNISLLR